ncbi:MAG: pyridoxal phosphate-dependent aminotransferase [Acidilobus sp.]
MSGASLISRIHGGWPPPGAIDFSSPSNPLGPPEGLVEEVYRCVREGAYKSYPTSLYRGLYDALAEFIGSDPGSILPLNGAAEALNLIPLALGARSLVVVEPNFGDHELMAVGLGLVLRRPLLSEVGLTFRLNIDDVVSEVLLAPRPSVVILSRPNNPTGHLVPVNVIDELSSRLPRDATLVVDEAFVELSSGRPLHPRDDLIVVRSLTKAFSTPGLRLGAIITLNRGALERVASAAQAWPVDSITACSFSRFLQSQEARLHVKRGAEVASEGVRKLLESTRLLGIVAYESSAPFVLLKHDRLPNPPFLEALRKRGVNVRDCSSFYGLGPSFSRVSVRLPGDNEVLLRALREVLGPRG